MSNKKNKHKNLTRSASEAIRGSQVQSHPNSIGSSPVMHLKLVELPKKVPVLISRDLQAQIRYLCENVWDKEWSGILFYSTENELGDENFRITAEGLFLMDIGTSGYTEYDTDDPKYIEFLMKNPTFRRLKKGHIHSHNTMSVFFSGTDTSEIRDNSAFHNFYLSLIVNNKNEMCAKIAFRAESTLKKITTIVFKGTEGSEVTKQFEAEEKEQIIYVYECLILKPEVVEGPFSDRFREIETIKAEQERKKKEAFNASNTKTGAYGGFNVNERYRQAGLYDGYDDDVIETKYRQTPKVPGETVTKGGIILLGQGVKEKAGKWERGHESGELDLDRQNKKRDKELQRLNNQACSRNISDYRYLVKLLSGDATNELDDLSDVLEELQERYFDKSTYLDIKYFKDSLKSESVEIYISEYPSDKEKYEYFDDTMEACRDMLKIYSEEFPELVKQLREALNLTLKVD